MKRREKFIAHVYRNRQTYIWISVFILFVLTASRHATLPVSLVITSITVAPLIILALILRHFLIPKFLHRHRWIYYTHSFIIIAILTGLAELLDINIYRFVYLNGYMSVPDEIRETIQVGQTNIGVVYLYAKYLVLLTITLTVVTISYMIDERKRVEQATKDQQMQQELRYLRAQINPHFLFNALNCIYALSMTNDEKAPDSILKLSNMMRFVIDDCRAESIPIAKEVAYIRNYIDFQKIRMEKKPNLEFCCEIENECFAIPPMVFQPMVENCFKHSRIVDDAEAYIKISLIQKDNHVTFITDNSKHITTTEIKDDERTGIGINNVRQRLDLLFGNNYKFEIYNNEKSYITKLYI